MIRSLLPLLLLSPAVLHAKTIAPGVSYTQTKGYHVVVAALDSKSVEVRVPAPLATPAKNKRTVSQWAQGENALIALNANFFGGPENRPCGAARGYGTQYPGIYAEPPNCVTSLGWAQGGKGGVFASGGREADAGYAAQFTEVVTGGGLLLKGGARSDWNHGKLAEGRACTAAGLSADRKRIILVVTNTSACTGKGLQDVLLAAGAADAVHLDGGGSSKLWLRGAGYVNDVKGDRLPPVAIVVKAPDAAGAKCPADCGKAACVETLQPVRSQCVGKPCRAGLSASWSCDSTLKKRIRCSQGVVVSQPCAVACVPTKTSGGGDCAPCPSGGGLYCGGGGILGEADTLYRCSKGVVTSSKKCAKACVRMPAGTSDRCE